MESNSPSNALKVIKMIHRFLTGGPVLFAIFALYSISSSSSPQLIDMDDILMFLPIGFTIMVLPISNIVFKSTLKQNIEGKTELAQKIGAFQTSHIIRTALLEGAALFAVVISFNTNTYVNLITCAIIIGFMLITTPSVLKLTEALKLTREEASSLQDQD